MERHKHKFRVSGPMSFRGKSFITMKCDGCPEHYHVERGWFQSVRAAWWVGLDERGRLKSGRRA